MSELTIFNNPEFGDVRVIGDSDNPRFCLSDVCKVLELQAAAVMRRLGDDVTSSHPIVDNLGRTQMATFVNEDGLYDVILDSRKPEAKRFHKWITAEVLPSIRKHGVYATGDFLSKSIADLVWVIGVLTELKAQQEEAALLKTQLAEAKPKADYCDSILQWPDLGTTSSIARDYDKVIQWPDLGTTSSIAKDYDKVICGSCLKDYDKVICGSCITTAICP